MIPTAASSTWICDHFRPEGPDRPSGRKRAKNEVGMKWAGSIFSLLAAAAVVSCGKEAVERRGEEGVAIGFATHLTRGTSIGDAIGVAAGGGFSVWAYKHSGDWEKAPRSDKRIMIDNTGYGYGHVTGDATGTQWDYGTPQIWPIGRKASFFACAPHGCAAWDGTTDAQGVPKITYTVPTAVADQRDLMIATPVLNAVGPDPVREVFHHALSRITFSALKSPFMTGEVIVTGVEFKNVRYSGSVWLQTSVSWTPDDYTGNRAIGDEENELLNSPLNDLSTQNITAPGAEMFLMPQTLDNLASMVITFTVDGLELSWSGEIPPPGVWEPGKAYNYKLFVDGEMVVVVCGELETPTDGTWGDYSG